MANPLVGQGDTDAGVVGTSNSNDGVVGKSNSAFGVFGSSESGVGVRAVSLTAQPALQAQAKGPGTGVQASSEQGGIGVSGFSGTGNGVLGESTSASGVQGISQSGVGVFAEGGSGVGLSAKGGRLAGFFDGHVQVTGDFRGARVIAENVDCSGDVRLTGADCAEHFDVTPDAVFEPGTVMAIGDGGALDASTKAYDKKVAGVVSGAGSFRPAVILDRQPSNASRPPIALVGKVYCKVDAGYGAVEVGDLLTTSDTLGHAMKVNDPGKAFGAVIGKALRPLKAGQELIPILIALQ